MVFCLHCKLMRAVINYLLNCQFLIPYFIQFFETFLYCTILNAFSTGCLVVIGAGMKKEKQRLKLMVFCA